MNTKKTIFSYNSTSDLEPEIFLSLKSNNDLYEIDFIDTHFFLREDIQKIFDNSPFEQIDKKIMELFYTNVHDNLFEVFKTKSRTKGNNITFTYLNTDNGVEIFEDISIKEVQRYNKIKFEILKNEIKFFIKELFEEEKVLSESEGLLEDNFKQRSNYSELKNLIFDIKIGKVEIDDKYRNSLKDNEINQLFNFYQETFVQDFSNKLLDMYEVSEVYTEGRSGGWLVIKNDDIPPLEEITDRKEEVLQAINSLENISKRFDEFKENLDDIDSTVFHFNRIEEQFKLISDLKEELEQEKDRFCYDIEETIKEFQELIDKAKEEFINGFDKFIENNSENNSEKNKKNNLRTSESKKKKINAK